MAQTETGLDVDIFRSLGRAQAPAVIHFSSFEGVMLAFSSLLSELIQHAQANHHGADVDLTISYDDGALHVGATALGHQRVAQPLALTLMLSPLTDAEQRVLAYLPTNLTFAAIADKCFVSRNTVKTQAISIYRKLGVTTRHDAVMVAQELALLRPGP